MIWLNKTLTELHSLELLNILRERIAVFVVEQNCPYAEVDVLDAKSHHLYAMENEQIVAYCRYYLDSDGVHIGRVLVTRNQRGKGLAGELMQRAIVAAKQTYPQQNLHVQAQSYLQNFYAGLGFVAVSDVYLEDNIPHLDMIMQAA